jgi:hydroxymethylpyrimidine pyrophosphatase-like HAD family hydrolase
MLIEAVVTDFDASFTEDQGTASDRRTWAEVRRLKAAGVKVILNTGRDLDYLLGPTGVLRWSDIAQFDLVIAEDGAVAWDPSANEVHILGEPVSPYFVDALRRTAGAKRPENRIDPKELWLGHASIATMRDKLPIAQRVLTRKNAFLRRLGIPPIDVQPIVNGGSVTWVKTGVDKGTGMLWALHRLGVRASRTVAIGDGENDAAFLRLAAVAAPVANAKPELHALANAIPVRGRAGAGFREVARNVLSGALDDRLTGGDIGLAV